MTTRPTVAGAKTMLGRVFAEIADNTENRTRKHARLCASCPGCDERLPSQFGVYQYEFSEAYLNRIHRIQ